MNFARSRILLLFLLLPAALSAQTTLPTLSTPITAPTLATGSAPATIDLRNHFTLPGVTGTVVQLSTASGRFNFELFDDTPISKANFLSYVNGGAYANTIIHRSVPGFVIQGGGYTYSVSTSHIPVSAAIRNEFARPNIRGTVAMAKVGGNPDSATSEWFVNLADNRANLDNQNGGFTVFARVIGNGMAVVDGIAALQTANITFSATVALENVPVRSLTAGQTQLQLENLVPLNSATVIPIYPTNTGSTAVLAFSATSSSPAIVAASLNGSTLTLTPGAGGTANVSLTASDSNGSTATQTLLVTVTGPGTSRAPVITVQPQPLIRLASGASTTVAFTVAASGTPSPEYQWRRDRVALAGQRAPTCILEKATEALAGAYTCVVSNSEGSVESLPAVISFAATSPADTGRLINLSILSTLAARETMTMGTVLGGTGTNGSKAVLARAAGPALTQLGVGDVLPDPQMSLLTAGSGLTVATNNDWAGTSALRDAFTQVGAFAYAAANSKDAAIFQPNLASGGYTVQLSDAASGAGFAIAELYDSTPSSAFTATTPRLINVSVLKQIPEGSALTAGFVIGGKTAKTVLVRAIGPALAAFGVSETMADPQLTLFNASSVKIAENDNWGGDASITAAAGSVGAFALSNPASNDAILLLTLAPGNYSVQVSGKTGGGSALVEVYEVP